MKLLKKQWWWIAAALVLGIATIVRLWQLGAVPSGLAWDEAAIGYNGYAIVEARRDEWLNRLPVSFRSFGDYKAPLAIYVTGPFVYFLGSSAVSVRLPFVLAGIGAVAALIWVSRLILDRVFADTRHQQVIVDWGSLAVGLLLAVTPWHVHYSRLAFEVGLALFWMLVMIGAWLEWWRGLERRSVAGHLWLVVAAVAGVAGLYTYHSAKLTLPLLGLGLVLISRRQIIKHWKAVVGVGLLATALCWPLLRDTVWGEGGTRFEQSSVFTKGYSPTQLVQQIGYQVLVHADPAFILAGQTDSLRHGDGQWGVLLPMSGGLWFMALILVIGSWLLNKGSAPQDRDLRPWLVVMTIGLGIFVSGVLPAAITDYSPHSNRSLLALPGAILMVVGAGGWIATWLSARNIKQNWSGTHGEKQLVLKSVVGTLLCVEALFAILYLHDYFTNYAATATDEFNAGYLEVIERIQPWRQGTPAYPKPSEIVFTTDYGQPYIYVLLAQRVNPIWWQGGSLAYYKFVSDITEGDLERQDTIIVASGSDPIPLEAADDILYGPDGSVRFKVYYQ